VEDFASRVPAKLLNKKLLESLAKSGALDCFGERGMYVAQYDKIAEFSKSAGDAGTSQTDMFQSLGAGSSGSAIEFDAVEPVSTYQKLLWEKETLGLYVSSHPLAGLKKYISKKARLVESLDGDDVGRKITVAGIVEQTKILHTKKGESMAILTIEDPTGRMEVMLFPRAYGEYKELIEKPGSMLVIAGTLDMRMGLPQLKADAMKRASIETMVDRAKADGMFNEQEATDWRGTARKHDEEVVETVTEEGEVIKEQIAPAAPSVPVALAADSVHGPLAAWILGGQKTEEPLAAVGLAGYKLTETEQESQPEKVTSKISIHTIDLPGHAPKTLLLDIKNIFETFPGSEKVQLKIDDNVIPVGLTITMSPILEKRIEEAIKKYEQIKVG
jgi:hypothetical protein